MSDDTTPKLTQRLRLHLNGGSEFSVLDYDILMDGQETGIVLHKRTDGSPHYRYTEHALICGEHSLDLLPPPPNAVVRAWMDKMLGLEPRHE